MSRKEAEYMYSYDLAVMILLGDQYNTVMSCVHVLLYGVLQALSA